MEHSIGNPRSTQEGDQIARSNKKPKRKITNYIFDKQNEQDEQMQDVEIQQRLAGSHVTIEKGTQVEPRHPSSISFRDMLRGEQTVKETLVIQQQEEDDGSDDDSPPEDYTDEDRCPVILLSKEEKKVLRKPWRNSLIIKMFDGKLGYMGLMRRLKKKWNIRGELALTDIGCRYFIASVSADSEQEKDD